MTTEIKHRKPRVQMANLAPRKAALKAACFIAVLSLAKASNAQTACPTTPINSFETVTEMGDVSVVAPQTANQYLGNATDGTHSLQVVLDPQVSFPTVTIYLAAGHAPVDLSGCDTLKLDVVNPSYNVQPVNLVITDSNGTKALGQYLIPGAIVDQTQPTTTTLSVPMGTGLPSGAWTCAGVEGMRVCPGTGLEYLAVNTNGSPSVALDKAHVVSIALYQSYPNRAIAGRTTTVYLDRLAAASLPGQYATPARSIDRYGQHRSSGSQQYTPHLIATDADFATDNAAEAVALQNVAYPSDWDSNSGYLGCKAGSNTCPEGAFTALGYFRTASKIANGHTQYWIVDPNGNRMFVTAMSAIRWTNSQTESFIDSTATGHCLWSTSTPNCMFAELPSSTTYADYYKTISVGSFNSTTCQTTTTTRSAVDFYHTNASIKYGPQDNSRGGFPPQPWIDRISARMKAWRFNTLESPSNAFNGGSARIPYEIRQSLATNDVTAKIGGVPDPFESDFATVPNGSVYNSLHSVVASTDPYLVGYFIDNELAWGTGTTTDPTKQYSLVYSIFTSGLTCTNGQPHAAKVYMTENYLEQRYSSVAALLTAWNATVPPGYSTPTTWADFESTPLASFTPPTSQLSDMLTLYAREYYKTVQTVLKQLDPNHLYMGSRFAGTQTAPLEVVQQCTVYCDVISFNWYHDTVDSAELSTSGVSYTDANNVLHEKPVIISEFHFGSKDVGLYGSGLVPVTSEAQRSARYQTFLNSAVGNGDITNINNRLLVGVNWFLLIDDPVVGAAYSGPAENFHIGFVSVSDYPYDFNATTHQYTGLAATAAAVNGNVYTTRGFVH